MRNIYKNIDKIYKIYIKYIWNIYKNIDKI
jgi:hypothetical protein